MKSTQRTASFALSALAGAILLMGPAIAITASKAEGRADKVSGAGFVLMVSLQRMG